MALGKMSIGAIIAIALTGMFLTLSTTGLLTMNLTVPSTGTVSTINVNAYSDSACTQTLTTLNWGNIAPGNSVTKTVYVKNTGNAQVTLKMTKTNWNPTTAGGVITVSWNKEGTTLGVSQVATATFTLSAPSSISGITTFTFDIVITGTG